jgi:predicted NAD/FAD-dependent oxidoreductase
VDSGASYLTASTPEFIGVVEDWVGRGLLRAWTYRFPVIESGSGLGPGTPGPLRYAAPRGLRSLVADLAARGGVRVHQAAPVGLVGPGPTVDGERADAVVLAMPDPQALRHLDPAFEAERATLAGRSWSSVLALLAGWRQRSWSPIDGAFVHGDDIVAWIADDGRRRGDDAPVLVAHSTAAFAAERLADPRGAAEPQAASGLMLDALVRLLDIPDRPAWTYVHRWTYARPAFAREQAYFLGETNVGLAGDGWGEPRVETAWRSGTALGRALAERLTS